MATFAPKQRPAAIPVSTGPAPTRLVTSRSLFARHPTLDLQSATTGVSKRPNQTGEVEERSSGRETKSRQPSASASLSRTDFTRIPVHALPIPAIQTKLTVNKPGDEYEQEADRVAEHVMRMPAPGAPLSLKTNTGAAVQRKCSCGGSCEKCIKGSENEKDFKGNVRRKASGSSSLGSSIAPPIVNQVLSSPGQPLDPSARAFMEPRFGRDFSRIRVHSSGAAERSAREVNAHAYTWGHNVVFGAGKSTANLPLLAHELAHVIQQSSSGASSTIQCAPAATSDPKQDRYKAEGDAHKIVGRIRQHGKVSDEVRALIKRQLGYYEGSAREAYIDIVDPVLRAYKVDMKADISPAAVSATDVKKVDTPRAAGPAKPQPTLEHRVDILEKRLAATNLDAYWRAKFGGVLANYAEAVYIISGGLDRAAKGFQDAQNAQAATDAVMTQLFGLIVSVSFAGGFEWAFSKTLGRLGIEMERAKEEIVEAYENPANAAVGGYVTNIRGARQAQGASVATPANISNAGTIVKGSAVGFLADSSAVLEQRTKEIENAFEDRSTKLAALTDTEWESLNVSSQEAVYKQLLLKITSSGSGADKLKSPEEVAKILEKHMWAIWILKQPSESGASISFGAGLLDRRDTLDLPNFGIDINLRLIEIGIEYDAHVGLREKWYQYNSDHWVFKILKWAANYNESIAK